MRLGVRTARAACGALALVALATGCSDKSKSPTAVGDAVQSQFTIDLRILGSPTASETAAVKAAVQTWRSVILSDLPAVDLTSPANTCFTGQPALNETVHNLLLYVHFTTIDGAGKTLAASGPCYVRSGTSLPIMGSLVLDQADLPALEANGELQSVITHEIGHILGFGTIWTDLHLLNGARTDPLFLGSNALTSYLALGVTGSGVPVENTGGSGTRDSHWRESIFGNELMTGYINSGANPLSSVTIAAMRDLGYQVDPSRAQAYSLPAGSGVLGDVAPLDIEPHEVLLSPRHQVDVSASK